jgi:hypothetical protein
MSNKGDEISYIGRGCGDVRWELIALKVLIASDSPGESDGTPPRSCGMPPCCLQYISG